jgi:aspartyl/glutamyl-tRNA(Asn/Gln) amidotransferase C subunit
MLDDLEFQNLCKLARVSIGEGKDEALSSFLEKLHCIFDWVRQLQSIDTSSVDIEIMGEGEYMGVHSREDDVCSEMDNRDQVLSNTEFSRHGMFSVPKVVLEYE